MNDASLPIQIFDHFLQKKTQSIWFTNSRNDLQTFQITTRDFESSIGLRTKLKRTPFPNEHQSKTFSDEWKLAYSTVGGENEVLRSVWVQLIINAVLGRSLSNNGIKNPRYTL